MHKLVDAAVKAGGKETRPMQDHGFMISRSFDDLDGHTWEVIYMNPLPPAAAMVHPETTS